MEESLRDIVPVEEFLLEASETLDVNTADRDALIALPGIGPALADRILAARPFRDLDDLQQRVRGFGPVLLERLAGRITVTGPAGEETALPDEEAVAETAVEEVALEEAAAEMAAREAALEEAGVGEMEEAPEAASEFPEAEVVVEQPEPPTQPTPIEQQATVTRTEAFWMAIGSGVLSFLLSLAAILGLLFALNGGLRFVRPGDLNRLAQQVAGIRRQTEALNADLGALRERVNNLQNLSPRVERLETSLSATEQAIGDLAAQAEALQQQSDDLAAQVESLQAQTGRFDEFLTGLYDLLSQFFAVPAPEGGAR